MNISTSSSNSLRNSIRSRTAGWTFIAPATVAVLAMIASPGIAFGQDKPATPPPPPTTPLTTPPPAARPATPGTRPQTPVAVPPATGTSAPTNPKRSTGDEGGTISNRPVRERARPNSESPTMTSGAATPGTNVAINPDGTRTAPPGAAAPEAAVPVVRFDPEVLDFGEMTAGIASTKKIKIFNISDQPVTITKAVPGCGCTTPSWPKEPILPGAFGEAEITLRPPETQGVDLNKKVTFQLDGHPPVVYTLKGHVAEHIKVAPMMMDAPAKDATNDGEITLTSVDGTAFKIVGVNPPVVKDLGDEAKTEHKVHIDWPTWNESGKSPKLAFTTDHPKATTLTVIVKRAIGDTAPTAPQPRPQPATPSTNPLIQAVHAGDATTVKLLLANGTDPNTVDSVGGNRTALHWAVKEGKKDLIPILLDAKANIEAKDRVGKTPLTVAAEGRDIEIVKILVERGADVNARDQIGGSPLLWASGLGSPEVVKFLIEKKADVNVVDVNGLSPLLWASSIGSPDAVKALVAAGAKVDVADKMTGDTALMRAARTGKVEAVVTLIGAKANVNAKNNMGHTAFMLASASGSIDKLEALKKAGADVTAKDVRGWNALDHANNRIDADKPKVVAFLKEFVPASGAAVAPEPTTTPAGVTPAAPATPASGKQ